ncbi:MAG: alpha/beta fold hydrolase [Alphaproteobacteria bacterium]
MNIEFLKRSNKPNLAYCYTPPLSGTKGENAPIVMFLGGFNSDMAGTKAGYLEEQCKARGQGFIRFDYSGHGESDGSFKDGTIGIWKEDAASILDHINPQRVILVGSSMGGWISLLLALERPQKLTGLIGIAAAPDFTKDMWASSLSDEQRAEIAKQGYIAVPNEYSDEPYILTKALFDDAKNNFILDRTHSLDIPMVFVQGVQDPDVPWETTSKIQAVFPKADIEIVLIDDGDHRLSRPEDLEIINRELIGLSNPPNIQTGNML